MGEALVSVKQGRLLGKIDINYNGASYYTFHAIPYAKPPLGELRFKAPQPPESWEGTRDATKEGDACYSRHILFPNKIIGSENCLTLNVYTPNLPDNERKLFPVMFFVHSGNLTNGSSNTEIYGPQFLMCEDVILVTFNFRLGVFGFLSLEDPSLGVPGNVTMKDMVMALKWVQENIQQFNGDPKNVTIMGESSGGAFAHLLTLSPMSKDLFHKGIFQSGCAFNSWGEGRRFGKELAGYLGKECSTEKEILEVLMKASMEDLLKAQENLLIPSVPSEKPVFGVVIEKMNGLEPAFLQDNPVNILKSGNYPKFPLIIGYTSCEGMICSINKCPLITDFENAIPYYIPMIKGTQQSLQLAAKIKKYYYGDEEPSEANKLKFYLLQGDSTVFREVYRCAKINMKTSNGPVYFYKMSIETELNLYKKWGNVKEKGVSHGDDNCYLFKYHYTPEIVPDSIEEKSIRRFITLWTNFVRTGNPNPTVPNDLIKVEWPAATLQAFKYLDIDEELYIRENPEADRINFWEEIFATYLPNVPFV